MHVNGADGHNFLAIPWRQVSDQHADQGVQLVDLNEWQTQHVAAKDVSEYRVMKYAYTFGEMADR